MLPQNTPGQNLNDRSAIVSLRRCEIQVLRKNLFRQLVVDYRRRVCWMGWEGLVVENWDWTIIYREGGRFLSNFHVDEHFFSGVEQEYESMERGWKKRRVFFSAMNHKFLFSMRQLNWKNNSKNICYLKKLRSKNRKETVCDRNERLKTKNRGTKMS